MMTDVSIAVIGAGYVGLSTAVCLSSLGYRVVCAEVDERKVDELRRGNVSILEPDLPELLASGVSNGNLSFVVDAAEAVREAEFVYMCVPTPMGAGGAADLRYVEAVIDQIRDVLQPDSIVINKSTVPVNTATLTKTLIRRDDVQVVSNPEFLREGSAVADFLRPSRVVVGSDDDVAARRVAELYAPLDAPTVVTNTASAELAKYAVNGYLATKLSYINAMAELCERVGADISAVRDVMGLDERIGSRYLAAGPGWGGSCLPKDTRALLDIADAADFEFRLVRAAIDTNERQFRRIVEKVRRAVAPSGRGTLHGTKIGLLGLAFKAGTVDLRDSPALSVAALLRQSGAELACYDPMISPTSGIPGLDNVRLDDDVIATAKEADALVVLTEWPEFHGLDWIALAGVMKQPIVVDARNALDGEELTRAGFQYYGLGRSTERRHVSFH